MALELDHEVGDQLGGAGGHVVGEPDKALVFGLEQIVPAFRGLKAHAGELILVDHEAQKAGVNAVPVAVGVLVDVLGQVRGIHGNIGVVQEALGSQTVIGVIGAAEPDVGGGLAVLLLDLGGNLTGGQALIGGFDAVELLEVLAGGGEVFLLAGAVDNQRAFGLGGSDQIVHAVGIGGDLAHREQCEDHDQRQKQCDCFFHDNPPLQFIPYSRGAVENKSALLKPYFKR